MTNLVVLIGNMTADAELKTTPSGVSVCNFSIGVSRAYTQGEERVTDFFECTAWRGTAEAIAKYCKKGHKVSVVGSIQTRTYEDNNGSKRKVFDVIVKEVEFLTPRSNGETVETPPPVQVCKTRNKLTLQPMDDDSDIPF